MKQLLSLVFAAFLLTACQSSENSNSNTATSPELSSEQANAEGEKMPAINPAHGQPYHDCSIAVGAPLVAKKAPADGTKLNPAHGQPGHRCDVAVGAPLS